ncbi:MAG TPA: hypothetical protein VMI54_13390 [Polyangiaceae bacterium]|nr:hypothetical protein [Polyangiaceae bacterium]
MRDVLDLIVQFVATIALSAWVVRRDVKKLQPELLSRAWPESTFWSAVVCFSPICVPVHFVRTRRSALGVALGVGWFTATVATVNGLAWVVDTAFGG